MRRQRNTAQMKEEIRTPEKELNKVEISNLSEAEFKTLAIRMLKELSEDLESIKKVQSETKDTLIEIKNNLQGNNRVHEAENQINDLEHEEAKNNQSEQQEERRIFLKNPKMRLCKQLLGQLKWSNIHIIGVPREEKAIENLFEKIMKENFPKLVEEIDMQVQEAQRVPNKIDAKRPTPIHIIINMPEGKDKERILKAASKKQLVTHRGVPIRPSVDFSK